MAPFYALGKSLGCCCGRRHAGRLRCDRSGCGSACSDARVHDCRGGKWAGVAAGIVFAMEVCLEYVFLPKDNTSYGLIEFGLVFFIYACAGAWLT